MKHFKKIFLTVITIVITSIGVNLMNLKKDMWEIEKYTWERIHENEKYLDAILKEIGLAGEIGQYTYKFSKKGGYEYKEQVSDNGYRVVLSNKKLNTIAEIDSLFAPYRYTVVFNSPKTGKTEKFPLNSAGVDRLLEIQKIGVKK